MLTLIIRIEERPEGDNAFPVRGLSVDLDQEAEAQHATDTIPWPLPELDPEQAGGDAAADIQQAMLAAGNPGFTPDQVGRYLWHLLAATEVASWWQEAEHAAVDGGVRTVLDVQASELRTLPWELLTGADGWRPFQSRYKPWVRGGGVGDDADDLLVPVRMLVVVGDPDDPDLRVDDELDAIVGAHREFPGRWHVDVLVNPALAVMRSVLEDLRPHILHVIAHGSVTAGSAILVISGDKQNPWELTTADVANLPTPAPRLVVLNACRSGAAAGNGLTASWTFTDAFLRHGCAAVVTMQGNIPSAAAVPFSAEFYREIAAGGGVDVAAAHGRQAASDARRVDKDSRSWAMPSLYTRVRPDRVLPIQLAVNPNLVRQDPYRAAFEPVGGHVDRTKERWKLLRCLAPDGGSPQQPLFVVAGPHKVGKSAVVKSTLLTCHLQGRRVAYVDLLGCGGEKRLPRWLTVLRYTRSELRLWLPLAAATPVQRFDHELAFLKEHQIPGEYTPESARSDDGQAFDQASEDFQEWIRRIFASFRTMLAATAGAEPLVLALDHLYTIYDPDLRNYVVPELLAPIAREEVTNVHAVLVGEASWFENLRVADPSLYLPEPIAVPMFRLGEIKRLGREYCARINKLPVPEPVVQLLNALRDERKECTGDELSAALKIVGMTAR